VLRHIYSWMGRGKREYVGSRRMIGGKGGRGGWDCGGVGGLTGGGWLVGVDWWGLTGGEFAVWLLGTRRVDFAGWLCGLTGGGLSGLTGGESAGCLLGARRVDFAGWLCGLTLRVDFADWLCGLTGGEALAEGVPTNWVSFVLYLP
jgi:hypothetical protein